MKLIEIDHDGATIRVTVSTNGRPPKVKLVVPLNEHARAIRLADSLLPLRADGSMMIDHCEVTARGKFMLVCTRGIAATRAIQLHNKDLYDQLVEVAVELKLPVRREEPRTSLNRLVDMLHEAYNRPKAPDRGSFHDWCVKMMGEAR